MEPRVVPPKTSSFPSSSSASSSPNDAAANARSHARNAAASAATTRLSVRPARAFADARRRKHAARRRFATRSSRKHASSSSACNSVCALRVATASKRSSSSVSSFASAPSASAKAHKSSLDRGASRPDRGTPAATSLCAHRKPESATSGLGDAHAEVAARSTGADVSFFVSSDGSDATAAPARSLASASFAASRTSGSRGPDPLEKSPPNTPPSTREACRESAWRSASRRRSESCGAIALSAELYARCAARREGTGRRATRAEVGRPVCRARSDSRHQRGGGSQRASKSASVSPLIPLIVESARTTFGNSRMFVWRRQDWARKKTRANREIRSYARRVPSIS